MRELLRLVAFTMMLLLIAETGEARPIPYVNFCEGSQSECVRKELGQYVEGVVFCEEIGRLFLNLPSHCRQRSWLQKMAAKLIELRKWRILVLQSMKLCSDQLQGCLSLSSFESTESNFRRVQVDGIPFHGRRVSHLHNPYVERRLIGTDTNDLAPTTSNVNRRISNVMA